MSDKLRVYLIKSLEDYLRTARLIELLQCELLASPIVTENEVLIALALSREEGSTVSLDNKFDKTASVALQYRDLTTKINEDTKLTVVNQLLSLKMQKERLDRCISLLSSANNTVITGMYIHEKTIKDLSLELHVSERTVQRYRDNAIDELVSMYELLEQIGLVLE